MKRFSLFTVLYLAAGVCLSAIALQAPDLAPNLKTSLLVSAGLLYIFAVLSIFSFWRQGGLRSQNRLRNQPTWKQNFVAIAPWLVIALTIVPSISHLLGQHWTTEAIARVALGLPVILLSAEQIFVRNHVLQ